MVEKEKFKLDITKFDGATIVKDHSFVEESHNTINMDKFRMNLRDFKSLHVNAMGILGLSKDKCNVAGLGDCQILTVCFAYFGPRRHNEADKSKDIIKIK